MSKQSEYELLCHVAGECTDCPEVFHKLTYLNENNGDINSPLMFIGEAPGFVRKPENRLKAFYGNQSGWNFEYLLHSIGIRRDSVFVTNALLHTPIKESEKKYDNDYGFLQIRPPSNDEITKCGKFLKAQLAIVNPRIICTIGRAALQACHLVLPNFPNLNLCQHVAQSVEWNDRIIFPLYHTSPNVTASIRTLNQMQGDFKKLERIMFTLKIQI